MDIRKLNLADTYVIEVAGATQFVAETHGLASPNSQLAFEATVDGMDWKPIAVTEAMGSKRSIIQGSAVAVRSFRGPCNNLALVRIRCVRLDEDEVHVGLEIDPNTVDGPFGRMESLSQMDSLGQRRSSRWQLYPEDPPSIESVFGKKMGKNKLPTLLEYYDTRNKLRGTSEGNKKGSSRQS
jgi:hypothetical protein